MTHALVSIGFQDRDAYALGLEHADDAVRQGADALPRLDRAAATASTLVAPLIHDPSQEVRAEAVAAIGRLGGRAGVGAEGVRALGRRAVAGQGRFEVADGDLGCGQPSRQRSHRIGVVVLGAHPGADPAGQHDVTDRGERRHLRYRSGAAER